ncbi:Probable type I restriction enzyme BthVORF4518P M protein, partial [Metamycoplasma alkalescens]
MHDLYHLEPNGIMAIVLPHGVLFRGNSEKQIRETLVKKGQIDTIIGLPANMFYGTSIPTIIMVLKKQRTGRDIFFVDASQLYIKDGKNNKFSHSHIKKISDIVNNKIEVSNLSRLVSYEEIKQNDFNLNISRYIDNFKKPEEYDLYSSMFGGISLEEMAKYDQFFATFPQIKNKIFSLNANDYYQIINNENDNIRQIILEDNDIKQYLNKYEMNANLLVNHIKQIIPSFKNMLNDKKPDIEENLSDFIFNDFEKIELLDIYDIYQIIVNNVDKITNDLELIYSYNEANKNITHKDILENEYERTKSGKNAKIVDW